MCGYFSLNKGGATVGDVMAADVVAQWLLKAGHPFDVVLGSGYRAFTGQANNTFIDQVPEDQQARYKETVGVCGPASRAHLCPQLSANQRRRRVALSVSFARMNRTTHITQPDKFFDIHVARDRDDSEEVIPDLAYAAELPRVPTVGLILMDRKQGEFVQASTVDRITQVVNEALAQIEVATISMSTRLIQGESLGWTPAAFDSAIRKMDVVVTSRMHGLVLALRNAVPVLAIDPIVGGAKVKAQAAAANWPVIMDGSNVTAAAVLQAMRWLVTAEARQAAHQARARALARLQAVEKQVVGRLQSSWPS